MVVTAEDGLLCFVDVTPDEQLTAKPEEEWMVMVGLIVDQEEGLPGLKQYKDTRPLKRKIDAARRLAEGLRRKEPSVFAMVLLGTAGDWRNFGDAMLGEMPERLVARTGGDYLVDGKRVPGTVARGAATYAAGMFMIASWAATLASRVNIKKVTLCLDRLPLDPDAGGPAELVKLFSVHPEIYPGWKAVREQFGVEFTVGHLDSYQKPGGDPQDGKTHPHANLTDWIAQSTRCAIDGDRWKREGADRTEEERKAMADVFFALNEHDRITVPRRLRLRMGDGEGSRG